MYIYIHIYIHIYICIYIDLFIYLSTYLSICLIRVRLTLPTCRAGWSAARGRDGVPGHRIVCLVRSHLLEGRQIPQGSPRRPIPQGGGGPIPQGSPRRPIPQGSPRRRLLQVGLYTILPSPILYGVCHTNGWLVGAYIAKWTCNSIAIG